MLSDFKHSIRTLSLSIDCPSIVGVKSNNGEAAIPVKLGLVAPGVAVRQFPRRGDLVL